MFINTRITLAVLAFTGSSFAAPTPDRTIHAGEGAITIPEGAKDIRVHQSYNKHHRHHGNEDPYEEKVHYRLPEAKRSHEGGSRKKHSKEFAVQDSDNEEVPAPSFGKHHHHREDRQATNGGESKKSKGHKQKSGKKGGSEEVAPAEKRNHVTVIDASDDGHSHGHRHSHSHSHDHSHSHKRELDARRHGDDTTIIYTDEDGHGHDHSHLHSHSHSHSHSHKRQEEEAAPEDEPEAEAYEPEASDEQSEPVEEQQPASSASSEPSPPPEKKPNKVDANAGKVAKTGLEARRHDRDHYRYDDDETIIIDNHGHRRHKGWYWSGRNIYISKKSDEPVQKNFEARRHHDTVIIENDGHDHDHEHSHTHSHSHSHKRTLLTRSGRPMKAKRDWMSEGTAGYIDVTSPLFGSDEGQRIASLVLSSGSNTTTSNSSFVLNASNGTRTEIYLVPTNSSNFMTSSDADSADDSLVEVSLKVPVFNPLTAATVPYCATFDPNPPSPCHLSVQKCGAADSEHVSQRFVYSPSTGVIRPLWAVSLNETLDAGNSTDAPSARKRDYVVQAAMIKATAVNTTESSNSSSSSAIASSTATPLASSSALPSSSSIPSPSSTVLAAEAVGPTSTSSPSNVQPAQSVSLVFTPLNPAAVLSVSGSAEVGLKKGKVVPSSTLGAAAPSATSSPEDGSDATDEDDEDEDDFDAESMPSSTSAPESAPTDAPMNAEAVSVSSSDDEPSSTSSGLPPLATPIDAGAPYS